MWTYFEDANRNSPRKALSFEIASDLADTCNRYEGSLCLQLRICCLESQAAPVVTSLRLSGRPDFQQPLCVARRLTNTAKAKTRSKASRKCCLAQGHRILGPHQAWSCSPAALASEELTDGQAEEAHRLAASLGRAGNQQCAGAMASGTVAVQEPC